MEQNKLWKPTRFLCFTSFITFFLLKIDIFYTFWNILRRMRIRKPYIFQLIGRSSFGGTVKPIYLVMNSSKVYYFRNISLTFILTNFSSSEKRHIFGMLLTCLNIVFHYNNFQGNGQICHVFIIKKRDTFKLIIVSFYIYYSLSRFRIVII